MKGLTFGEKLVGIKFNPSEDNKVDRAKKLFAEAANLIEEEYRAKNMGGSPITEILYNHTIGEILNAQMNVVKLITFNK